MPLILADGKVSAVGEDFLEDGLLLIVQSFPHFRRSSGHLAQGLVFLFPQSFDKDTKWADERLSNDGGHVAVGARSLTPILILTPLAHVLRGGGGGQKGEEEDEGRRGG